MGAFLGYIYDIYRICLIPHFSVLSLDENIFKRFQGGITSKNFWICTSVLVIYYCMTSHPKVWELNAIMIYIPHESPVWVGLVKGPSLLHTAPVVKGQVKARGSTSKMKHSHGRPAGSGYKLGSRGGRAGPPGAVVWSPGSSSHGPLWWLLGVHEAWWPSCKCEQPEWKKERDWKSESGWCCIALLT